MIVDGYPVVFSVELVTEPGEGWKGSRFIGGPFRTLDEVNCCINEHREKVPVGWMLKVDFQDDLLEEDV